MRGRRAEDALVWPGFDQAPCALAVFDTDLRVVRANAGMERALGLTSDQMRGLRAPECFPHPEVEKNELLMRRVLETAEQHHRESFLRVPGEKLLSFRTRGLRFRWWGMGPAVWWE
ncbi:PAS domain-containing protein [Streptomyces sp. NPDC050743]|uniref:PAS domain-containing protein n=1 Tax=Streptomyces sp. NPDC050743 TaxID=3365634 RepID=UPI0037AEDE66